MNSKKITNTPTVSIIDTPGHANIGIPHIEPHNDLVLFIALEDTPQSVLEHTMTYVDNMFAEEDKFSGNIMINNFSEVIYDSMISCSIGEENKGKPPVGRTQKSHNAILSLNSKRKF